MPVVYADVQDQVASVVHVVDPVKRAVILDTHSHGFFSVRRMIVGSRTFPVCHDSIVVLGAGEGNREPQDVVTCDTGAGLEVTTGIPVAFKVIPDVLLDADTVSEILVRIHRRRANVTRRRQVSRRIAEHPRNQEL